MPFVCLLCLFQHVGLYSLHKCKALNEIVEIAALSCISKINVSTMNARQKIFFSYLKGSYLLIKFTFLLTETRHFFCDLKMESRVCYTADIPFSLSAVKLTVLQHCLVSSICQEKVFSLCRKLTKHDRAVVWFSFLV